MIVKDIKERHIRQPGTGPEFLSYRSAAELADCSTDTIRRLVKAGRITAVYLTPDTPRVPRDELLKLATGGAA